MICALPSAPSFFPPSRMEFQGGRSSSDDRPTLPSIRDLFSDELSRSPRVLPDSPSLTLARLRVSDEEASIGRGHALRPSPRSISHYEHTSSPVQQSFYPTNPPAFYSPSTRDLTRSRSYNNLPNAQGSQPRSMTFSTPPHNATHYHRNTVATGHYRYDSRISRHLPDERNLIPDSRYSITSASTSSITSPMQRPRATISTSVDKSPKVDDDDQTPVAIYRKSGPSFGQPRELQSSEERQSRPASSSGAKYECNYCGKGFNRPSSLKIHINSHTGEKPFVCTVEGCGRSFSVLSNMRRHQRVHAQPTPKQPQESGDEASSPPTPLSARSTSKWKHRRDSSASTTSTASRRSRSVSSDEDEDEQKRAEKRTRRFD